MVFLRACVLVCAVLLGSVADLWCVVRNSDGPCYLCAVVFVVVGCLCDAVG